MSATISSTVEERIEVIENDFNKTRKVRYGIVKRNNKDLLVDALSPSNFTNMEKCLLVTTVLQSHVNDSYYMHGTNLFKMHKRTPETDIFIKI